jgi:autotransporter-associated beta strand protein
LAVKVLSFAIVLALTAAAHAQILRWDSSGANPTAPVDGPGNWNTTDALWSNLSANVAWDNTSRAYFGNFGVGNTVTINQGEVIAAGINFNPLASGHYTIAGDSSNTLNLSNATINIDFGQTPVINAPITGTVGLSAIFVNNTGSLTLDGSNTYTGETRIDGGGTLKYTADNTMAGLTIGTTSGASSTPSALDLTDANLAASAFAVRVSNATPNTVTIGSGKTMTVNGPVNIGFDPASTTQTTRVNVTGDSLVVNSGASNFFVGNNSSGSSGLTAIFDMSGLSNFTFSGAEFNMGGRQANTSGNRSNGQVTLANTANSIAATTMNVGAGSNSNAGGNNQLHLGAGTNVINADAIHVGTHKSTGTIDFASGTGSLVMRNNSGGDRIPTFNVGRHISSGTVAAKGNLLLNGHDIDILAGTMMVGEITSATTNAAAASQVQFDAGVFDVTTMTLGQRTGTATGTANATLTMGGGNLIVNSPSGPGGGSFTLGNNTSSNTTAGTGANGTLIINGGVADVYTNIVRGANGAGSASSSATINLDGGTLDMHGFSIGAAGATNLVMLNAMSGTLQNLAQINGGGGLTKTGIGTLDLNSTFYTGLTTVVDGTLDVNGRILDPFSGVSVDSDNNSDGLLNLNFSGTNVVSSLSINGSPVANGLWGSPTSGAPNTSTFLGGTGTLNVGGTLDLTRWTGAHSSEWSTAVLPSPKNWELQSNPTTKLDYQDGDRVLFDDIATNTTVNIDGADVTPATVEFNNSTNNYTLGGSNGIAGFANVTLTKNGSGTVTITNPNTYAGTTTINAGTLQIGNGGTTGSLGTGAVTDDGALVFNRSDGFTVANSISGAGTVTMAGTGVLTLSGTSTYTGATTVSSGTLKATNGASTGNTNGAALTVASGATFDIGGNTTANNFNVGAKTVHISGNGVGGTAGALANSGGATQNNAFNNITLDADALIAGARMDIGRTTTVSPRTLDLANHTLTLNMSGSQPIFSVLGGVSVTAGDIVVTGGGLNIETDASVGNVGGTITFNSGTILQVFRTTAGTITRPMIFKGNNIIGGGSNSGTVPTVNSDMTLEGNVTLQSLASGVPNDSNNSLILAGSIGESGGSFGITKVGINTVTLSGSLSYTGDTTISAGTLSLSPISGPSTLSNMADVLIDSGAILNLNFTGQDTIRDLYLAGSPVSPGTYDQSNGLGFLTGAGALVVTGGVGLPGDYNNDGKVNAADYVLWRKNPDAFGGNPAGYNTWRSNFGNPPGSGSSVSPAAVPEPGAFLLAWCAIFGAVLRRSRGVRFRVTA